jgi:hypothetical protein
VATALLCLGTILCNVKHEEMCATYLHNSLEFPKFLWSQNCFCTNTEGYVTYTCDKFRTNPKCYFSEINFQTNFIACDHLQLWSFEVVRYISQDLQRGLYVSVTAFWNELLEKNLSNMPSLPLSGWLFLTIYISETEIRKIRQKWLAIRPIRMPNSITILDCKVEWAR